MGEREGGFFADLPEDIDHEILVKVPPKDVYKNGRLVCRAWRDIISRSDFVARNFLENISDLQLLVGRHRENRYCRCTLVEIEKTSQQLDYHYKCKLQDTGLNRMGRVRSSCNGLILVDLPKQKGLMQVMNLITTTVGVPLPKCPSDCPHQRCESGLGFDPITETYKVVHLYAHSYGFEILTLGSSISDSNSASVEKWRRVPGPWKQNLFRIQRPFNDYNSDPISVNGQVLHWFVFSDEPHIVSMDVSEEIPLKTNLPDIGEVMERDRFRFVEMSGHLSFVHSVTDHQIDVWILEDLKKQLWSKKHSIRSELINYLKPDNSLTAETCSKPNLSKLAAVACLRDGEILILHYQKGRCLYAYDIRRRVLKKILKMNLENPNIFIPHRSSLLQ